MMKEQSLWDEICAPIVSICIALALMIACSGCPYGAKSNRTIILPESSLYYKIPAGTAFKAVVEDEGPVVEVVSDIDLWVTSSGKLMKWLKEENRDAAGIPE